MSLFRFVPLPGTQVYEQPDKYGIRGTHLQPGWDGDWSAFHIHHNDRRWWGTDNQWVQVDRHTPLGSSSRKPGEHKAMLGRLRRVKGIGRRAAAD